MGSVEMVVLWSMVLTPSVDAYWKFPLPPGFVFPHPILHFQHHEPREVFKLGKLCT